MFSAFSFISATNDVNRATVEAATKSGLVPISREKRERGRKMRQGKRLRLR